jgi:CHAD domain-containing protein
MSFRLERGEPVGEGLARVVGEEVESAISDLGATPPDVHEARKRFKKIRAVLKLAGGADRELAGEGNVWFRDAGRRISKIRDAEAVAEALDRIEDPAAAEEARPVRGRLRARLTRLRREAAPPAIVEALASDLRDAKDKFSGRPFAGDGLDAIAPAFARAFRKARRTFAEVSRDETDALLHELRKRTKDHWYHVRLIEVAWPERIERYAAEVKRLSDLLGHDHDCVLLKETIERSKSSRPTGALLAAIERSQECLRRDSRSLASRLFAEKPNALARRFEKYWDLWAGDQ